MNIDSTGNATEGLLSRAGGVRGNLTRQLANGAMGKPNVIPLWFGEPDLSTPDFICQAAVESLGRGETFYTEGLGRPQLRMAIAEYMNRLHDLGHDRSTAITMERIAVTVSGGNALNLAFQCVLEQGDLVVTHSPTFPNLLSIPALYGARVETVPMTIASGGWELDVEQLLDASRDAKVILINSPNNPTGWVMPREAMLELLTVARQRGIWLISDEVYSRIYFSAKAAPSFSELATSEDRLLVVNSFSKAWAMTGWRLGWLTVPASVLPMLERIIEFSVSSAPAFAQQAACVALEEGEDFVRECVARYHKNLQMVTEAFAKIERIKFVPPTATFYAYFQIEGVKQNFEFAQKLIDEAGVGLAPGTTFDANANDWYRLCFAQTPERLAEALNRLTRYLA